MDITISELIVWLIIGALAGSVAGTLATRTKQGYGKLKNTAIGLAGALIGGVIFNLLKVDLGLGELKVTAEDLVSAFLGSVLLLTTIWLIGKRKAKQIT